jgi:tetratricopeptide (TPR) repeat protein
MRHFSSIIRSFAGAAALATVAGCHHEPPAAAPVHISTPATMSALPAIAQRPDLGPSTPKQVVETAPPAAIAEEAEPSPNELVKQARDALTAGELDRALRLAKLAVVDAPGRSAAWNTLGRVQLRRGERDAALDSFAQAVETNPSSAWARNNHGLALLYAERFDEAIDELEQATDLSPSVGLMWNNLGMAYEHGNRLDEARSAYRRAISLDHRGATENFVRLEGVRSLGKTAKADLPQVDEDLPMVAPSGSVDRSL